jgi:hypothetical protein
MFHYWVELTSVLIILISLYFHLSNDQSQLIIIPLEISSKDGVVSTYIDIKTSSNSFVTRKIGLDTGLSYSWFLHPSCTIETSNINTELRQKLLVRSIDIGSTNHKVVPQKAAVNTAQSSLNIKYADGGVVKGYFSPNREWRFHKLSSGSQQPHEFYQLNWGMATKISEVVRNDQTVSHFEQASIDGWLGLGRSKVGRVNRTTMIISTALFSSVANIWSMKFQVQKLPYTLIFENLNNLYNSNHVKGMIKVMEEYHHWSTVVRHLRINGCESIEKEEYNILLDIGAGSIFTPNDTISSHCLEEQIKKKRVDHGEINMEFVLENGRKIVIPRLLKNASYHNTLRRKRGENVRQTIVLGLPFFMRNDVTLILAKKRSNKIKVQSQAEEEEWNYYIDI